MSSREFSDRTGALMTFHLSETRDEVYEHKKKTGKRPGDWLSYIGFLNQRCLAAHSAWLTISEVRALAKAGAPTFPQNIQECKRAVRWLRKNAARFQLNRLARFQEER